MKIELNAKALRAALHCAAKKDIRYYLNGVLVQVTGTSEAFIVGTNDGILFACRTEYETLDAPQSGPWELIIPGDIVKAINKKVKTVVLESLPDGRYMLDSKVFSAIDGKFPDYRRVIPSFCTEEAAQYDPALLASATAAVCEFYGLLANGSGCRVNYNGRQGAVISGPDSQAVAVVMPLLNSRKMPQGYYGFTTPCQSFVE